jgi:hypothetical protein
MSPDLYAWRASDEFAAAIRKFKDAKRTAVASEAIRGFNEAHPSNKLAWTGRGAFSMDLDLRGFMDDGELPEGLSRAQSRRWLLPVRGKKGDYWRDAVKAAKRAMPSLDAVFVEHKVATFTMSSDMAYGVGVFDDGKNVYLHCKGDIRTERPFLDSSPHIAPVTLSEYYQARELHELKERVSAAAEALEVSQ